MRMKFKGKTEKEINDELNLIIEVFILLINKIDFKVLIEKQLSERLIKNAYLSLTSEKNLILKITKEAGCNYTSIMRGMISDLDKSNKEMEEYIIKFSKSPS